MDGGEGADCIFCFRVTVGCEEAKNKAENPPLSPLQSQRMAGKAAHGGGEAAASGRIFGSVSPSPPPPSSFYFNFLFTQWSGAVGQSDRPKAEAALPLVARP